MDMQRKNMHQYDWYQYTDNIITDKIFINVV